MKHDVDQKLQKINYISDALALKKVRILRGLSHKEAGLLVNHSISTVKRKEKENYTFKTGEMDKYLNAYGCSRSDFVNIKLSRKVALGEFNCTKKTKIIENNKLRRSYKKIITNEVLALIHLREKIEITKREACKRCNYDQSAIGAIENGRITLTEEKIKHIVFSYGFKMKDFTAIVNSKIDRLKIENDCLKKLKYLSDDKLTTLSNLLKSF